MSRSRLPVTTVDALNPSKGMVNTGESTTLRFPQNRVPPLSTLSSITDTEGAPSSAGHQVILNLTATRKGFTDITRSLLNRTLPIYSISESMDSDASDSNETRLQILSAIPDSLDPQKFNPSSQAEEDDQQRVVVTNSSSSRKAPMSSRRPYQRHSHGLGGLAGNSEHDEIAFGSPRSGCESQAESTGYEYSYHE